MGILAIALLGVALLSHQPARATPATPATEALGNCMKDHTSGQDRKDLARWIFAAMSVHPGMDGLTGATDAARTETSKQMASLVTRLVTEHCVAQARVVARQGPEGMAAAFQSLGQVAMLELMSNPSVESSFGAYTEFVDHRKFEAALAK